MSNNKRNKYNALLLQLVLERSLFNFFSLNEEHRKS